MQSIKVKSGVLEWAVDANSMFNPTQRETMLNIAQNLFNWLATEAPVVINTQEIFYKMIEYAREEAGDEVDPIMLFSLGVLYEQAVHLTLTGGESGFVPTTTN